MPRCVARGFVNLVEVAFTPRGDAIGTDNWFQQPRGGNARRIGPHRRRRAVSLSPDKGTPQPVTGAPLPAVSLYPAVAHSGLAYVDGLALPRMQGSLLSAQHNTRRVVRHDLVAKGSTFETRDRDFVTTEDPDFHPSDVVEDADGRLLVIDTGKLVHPPLPDRTDSKSGGERRHLSCSASELEFAWRFVGIEVRLARSVRRAADRVIGRRTVGGA